MFPLIMFAIIGAELDIGVWYWVAYTCFAVVTVVNAIIKALDD
jgi:hypothetical protein